MNRPIKILYTIPNFDTAGSGKVVYDLVKGLDKNQFEPEICCFHNRGSFFKEIQSLGVKIHIFNFATSYKPYISLPLRILKIALFFKKENFDIIHSWHWSSDITEPLAAKLAGVKFVYTKKAMGWGNKAWKWRTQLSNRVIAVNKNMMSQFFQGKNNVDYIPFGVDVNYFRPQEPTEDLKNSLGIKPSDFVVISVANLVPVKGIEILLEAVKLINDTKIKVLVVGRNDNNYARDLMHQFADNNMLFLGLKQDVRPYLSLADVFVIPTLDVGEGLPIAPLEAMVSGCLVLGSNVSGVRDILARFPEQLFGARDVKGLKEKLKSLKKMSLKERNEIVIDIKNYITNSYSLEHFILKHESLYKELAL